MMVYVVMDEDYTSRWVVGVYSSKEAAEKVAHSSPAFSSRWIETHKVDE